MKRTASEMESEKKSLNEALKEQVCVLRRVVVDIKQYDTCNEARCKSRRHC